MSNETNNETNTEQNRTYVMRNRPGRPAGEERRTRTFAIVKSLDAKLQAIADKTGDSMNKIVNDALGKYLLGAVLLVMLFGSCKKPDPECYACQWVKQGKIQPGTEERCGPDVQTWALTVRQTNPQFYPICARKQ